ncbi:MAG TPA: asparagine synthase (glutamine-hydrolyzing), partial [Conexibacter sp.]|nr:asparagine synthase (glutamine-hydrolyzing) [Conexibacter sp.]
RHRAKAILRRVCGIGVMVGGGSPDPTALRRMAAAMAHRGPDGEGIWHDERAGLAFRRLAIIDLDPRSDQPLHLGPLHLVFNGEIYNYRELRDRLRELGHAFATEGDGEVLLHAWAEWGEGALQRLNGMFAFAVWDDASGTLVLATDRFGEKPAYWAEHEGRLLLASDVRALLQVEPALRAPRTTALGPYLARGVLPPIDESFFAGVRRLPGAHLLRWRDGRVKTARWWQPRPVEVPARYEEAVDEVRRLLSDAIRLRLRSDVAVGSSLSGGVDSSAIVGLAAELAGDHRRHAFTARFPGFERDEWAHASAVAHSAGVVEHHEVVPTADELLDDLEQLVLDQEEPFGSTSIYAQWRVMRAAREAGVTVLLDGQGADELFAGYPGIRGWAVRSMGPRRLLAGIAGPDRAELLTALGAERLPARAAWRHRRGIASPYASRAVVEEAVRSDRPSAGGRDPLRRELLRQAFHTSLPGLLRYADRNSMAHGREVRLPFLDHRVAELALSLPAAFLVRDGLTKAVLRDAAAGVVPAGVLARRDKVGYATPQARWFASEPFRARIAELLLDPAARTRELLDTAAVERDARAGAWGDVDAIWRAVNLELWLHAFERTPAAVR